MHTQGECLKAERELFMINLAGQREKVSVKQSVRGWWNFKGKRKKEQITYKMTTNRQPDCHVWSPKGQADINVCPNNRFFCKNLFHKNLSQFSLSFSFYMLSYLNAYILNCLHVFTKLLPSIHHSCLSSQTIWLHFILINKKSTEVTNDLTYLPISFFFFF